MVSLGTRLRKARIARGWSQPRLAARAGLSRVFVTNIELDKADPRVSVVRTLAKMLRIQPGDLLERGTLPMPCLLTATDAQRILRVSPGRFWAIVNSGALPFVRIGKRAVRFEADAMRTYIKE